jgi:hypothetical protein
MDTSSLVALGISILVILLVQTLVIISLAAHLFIRHSNTHLTSQSNIEPETDLGHPATLSDHLRNRNISAPLSAAQVGAVRSAPVHGSTGTLCRDPMPSVPATRQNLTVDERFARAFGPNRAGSSTYSQPSRANDEDSMVTGKDCRKEQIGDIPASHKYYFHDSD